MKKVQGETSLKAIFQISMDARYKFMLMLMIDAVPMLIGLLKRSGGETSLKAIFQISI